MGIISSTCFKKPVTQQQVEPISVVDLRTASIIYHPSNEMPDRRISTTASSKPSEAHGLDIFKSNRLSADWSIQNQGRSMSNLSVCPSSFGSSVNNVTFGYSEVHTEMGALLFSLSKPQRQRIKWIYMMRKKRVRVSAVAMVTFKIQIERAPSSSRDVDTADSLVNPKILWGNLKVLRQVPASLPERISDCDVTVFALLKETSIETTEVRLIGTFKGEKVAFNRTSEYTKENTGQMVDKLVALLGEENNRPHGSSSLVNSSTSTLNATSHSFDSSRGTNLSASTSEDGGYISISSSSTAAEKKSPYRPMVLNDVNERLEEEEEDDGDVFIDLPAPHKNKKSGRKDTPAVHGVKKEKSTWKVKAVPEIAEMDDNTADDEAEVTTEKRSATKPVYKKGPGYKRSLRKRRVDVLRNEKHVDGIVMMSPCMDDKGISQLFYTTSLPDITVMHSDKGTPTCSDADSEVGSIRTVKTRSLPSQKDRGNVGSGTQSPRRRRRKLTPVKTSGGVYRLINKYQKRLAMIQSVSEAEMSPTAKEASVGIPTINHCPPSESCSSAAAEPANVDNVRSGSATRVLSRQSTSEDEEQQEVNNRSSTKRRTRCGKNRHSNGSRDSSRFERNRTSSENIRSSHEHSPASSSQAELDTARCGSQHGRQKTPPRASSSSAHSHVSHAPKEMHGLLATATSSTYSGDGGQDSRKSNSSSKSISIGSSSGKISTYVSSRNSSEKSSDSWYKTPSLDLTVNGSDQNTAFSQNKRDCIHNESGIGDVICSAQEESTVVDRMKQQNREKAAKIIQNLPDMPQDLTDFAAYLTHKVELQCAPASATVAPQLLKQDTADLNINQSSV